MAPHLLTDETFLKGRKARDREGLADAIRVFYQRTNRVLDRLMRAQGASLARTKLLLFVEREGPVRSIDVAEAFGHTPRTVTEAIDALDRDGLVRRDPDPRDRRAKRISITPAGVTAIRGSEPSRCAFLIDVFEALDTAETADLHRLLGKLNARLEALAQGDG